MLMRTKEIIGEEEVEESSLRTFHLFFTLCFFRNSGCKKCSLCKNTLHVGEHGISRRHFHWKRKMADSDAQKGMFFPESYCFIVYKY